MDTILDAADAFLAETDAGFTMASKELVAVDKQYLDGPYDKHALVRRLQENAHGIAERYLLVGRDLLVLKAHCEHGEFRLVLDQVGISPRSASRFMQVAVKFGKPTLLTVAQRLPVSKLLELAQFDDEDLGQLLDGGAIGEVTLDVVDRMSASELKKALRKEMKARTEAALLHDQRIAAKDKQLDKLDTQLLLLNIKPDIEDWPGYVAETVGGLGAMATIAQSSIKNFYKYIENRHSLDMPAEAKEAVCRAYIEQVNALGHWVGKCQAFANEAFPEFVDSPIFLMGSELVLKDEAADKPYPQGNAGLVSTGKD